MEAWLSIPPIALVFSAIQSLQFNTSHSIVPLRVFLSWNIPNGHFTVFLGLHAVVCNLHNRAIPAVNSIQGLQAAAPECKGQELFIRNVKNFFGNAAWEGWSGFIGMSH